MYSYCWGLKAGRSTLSWRGCRRGHGGSGGGRGKELVFEVLEARELLGQRRRVLQGMRRERF